MCVGFADWDAELRTNQHHLMTRVSARTPVLFVESLGLRRPTASARDVRRMARRLRRGLRPLRRTGSVAVLSPLVVPLHGSRVLRRVNAFLLRRTVTRAMRTLGFDRPTLWAYVPHAAQLIEPLRPRFVVYHCVDNIGAHDRIDSASFDAAESTLVAKADLVIASSEPIRDRLRAVRAGRRADAERRRHRAVLDGVDDGAARSRARGAATTAGRLRRRRGRDQDRPRPPRRARRPPARLVVRARRAGRHRRPGHGRVGSGGTAERPPRRRATAATSCQRCSPRPTSESSRTGSTT